MCGRFAQSQTREDYLALLAEDIERDIPYDPEPIGRYNVAPGTGDKKQPYFIYRADGQPVFIAAIGSTPFERGDEAEGFLIVTAAADQGLVDIHDRRPLVLSPEAAREWMRQEISGKEASEIAASGCVPANQFTWHPVSCAVGNVKNQGAELIQPV
ncbi:SOS response-associated peptidase family protein [Escherichia coli]|uniref:SOS response-associated peptidase family protein n=1 Tax=Escherichia coli TaxID=562 RepID=UPI001CC5E9F6|nr:SOS response-associated peptidase family protein [Escherichia coli]